MKKILLLTLILLTSLHIQAAEKADSLAAQTIEKEASIIDEAQSDLSYKPQIFGAVKAKYEISTITGEGRFNVRNSRLGVKGLVTSKMNYAIQIDFNNEGNISILDSYVGYRFNKNWKLSLGQQQYHFSRDLDRGPSSNMFSNRSFIAKYITTYYGSKIVDGKQVNYVKSIGSRDIGALLTYKMANDKPFQFSVGLFNSTGANNPEWANRVNYVGKLSVGREMGFGGAVSYYGGTTPSESQVAPNVNGQLNQIETIQKLNMWGGELHYYTDHLLVEAEYAQRRTKDLESHTIHAAHVQSSYLIRLRNTKFFNHLSPLVRWDMGRGIEFINKLTSDIDRFNTQRLTAAINIGLSETRIRSELRLAFEKYMLMDTPSDFGVNPLLQDKFTFEVVASF